MSDAAKVEDFPVLGLLRELADAVDKDRGHDGSLLTRTMRKAADQIENVHGNIFLWKIGEIDAEKAMEGVRDAVE